MLVTDKDAQRIAADVQTKYGFTPPVVYCHDLAAFVLATNTQITELERRIEELANVRA